MTDQTTQTIDCRALAEELGEIQQEMLALLAQAGICCVGRRA